LQAELEAEAAVIRGLLARNAAANAGRSVFPWVQSGKAAPPERMKAYTARAVARQPNGAGVLASVYTTLAGKRWRALQGDLQRDVSAMAPGDLAHLNRIVEAVERFWIDEGYAQTDITLRRALGLEVAGRLDFANVALLSSLQVVLVMAHCARGDQVISDGNTCDCGSCLSTVMTLKLLAMASAGGGFGRGKKVLVITINGAPLCERDPKSECGCAAPKTHAEVEARQLFVELQTALVRAFFGPRARIAVMRAYTGHADGGTVGSVTLSQTGAAQEVALSYPHPASLSRTVTCAMGTGGTAERQRRRADAQAVVIDAVVGLRRWAAAQAVMSEPEPTSGLPVVPFAGLLEAIAAAVPRPVAIAGDELRAVWIWPAEASGASVRRTPPVRPSRGPQARAARGAGVRCVNCAEMYAPGCCGESLSGHQARGAIRHAHVRTNPHCTRRAPRTHAWIHQ
jgi:hypothetical protein